MSFRGGIATGAVLLLALAGRAEDHSHVAAVLLRTVLDVAVLGDLFGQPVEQSVPQLGTRLLATAEHDGDLDLVSLLQEADHVTLFGLVVVIIDLGAELLFLDNSLLLVLPGLAVLLSLFVFVLPVIHDLRDRRLRIRCDLDKVEVGFESDVTGVVSTDNADLLAGRTDQTDLRDTDTLINASFSADVDSSISMGKRRFATDVAKVEDIPVTREKPLGPKPAKREMSRWFPTTWGATFDP